MIFLFFSVSLRKPLFCRPVAVFNSLKQPIIIQDLNSTPSGSKCSVFQKQSGSDLTFTFVSKVAFRLPASVLVTSGLFIFLPLSVSVSVLGHFHLFLVLVFFLFLL